MSLILGLLIKDQASYSIFALLIFLILIRPFFIMKGKTRRKYCMLVLSVIFFLASFCVLDWNYTNIFFSDSIRNLLYQKYVDYVLRTGFNPLFILSKLIVRAFHFTLYHSIIWIPGIIVIIRFFRKREPDLKEGYMVFLAVFLFASVFLGGSRLSVHYFIPVLPMLSILSASYVLNKINTGKNKILLFNIFMMPVLFFFIWNCKDVYVRHFNPGLMQNETRAAFLFRAVALGSQGEYLLPHKSLMPVINYLKNTDENSKLMIWPMSQDVAYYSGRETAGGGYWYNELALSVIVRNEAGDKKALKDYEESFISGIEKLTPDYFVDISLTTMYRKALRYRKKDDPAFYFNFNEVPPVRFGSSSFGSLDYFPGIINYLNKNYIFIGSFENARVWKKPD